VGSIQEAVTSRKRCSSKFGAICPAFHGPEAFASWLYRITVNTALDALRRQPDEVPLESWHESQDPLEETVLRNDQQRCLRMAIESLPLAIRATLILREYEQLSYKEIAEALQIPIGTVMSRLNYARQALRKLCPLEILE
jgi:RNA polymerase sigma-70 factor (ECF subfamily)